ncbi:MAG: metalloregulator ArsR/SmtB family transcription factor [Candidatus Ozemobacteraceae bacterium]
MNNKSTSRHSPATPPSQPSLRAEVIPFVADILKAIGHPIRLRIIEVLAAGETSVGSLQIALGIPQPIVSQQLRILKSGGVVQSRKCAAQSLYSLAIPGLVNLLDCLRHCQDHCFSRQGSFSSLVQKDDQSLKSLSGKK